MSATFRIDTLKFAKRLADAGLTPEAAEAIVEALSEAGLSEHATESDIGELKTAIADLRADIYGRLSAMGVGIVGLTVALTKLLPG